MVAEIDYTEAEEAFFKELSKRLENLSLYCVTGSMARGKIIPGWSDIDILIGVHAYNKNTLSLIDQAINAVKTPIKIGTTTYCDDELLEHDKLDSKTLISLRALALNEIQPRVLDTELRLSEVPARHIIVRDKAYQAEILHTIKRCVQTQDPSKERELYKAIITCMKILLRRKHDNFTATSYDDVIQMFEEHIGKGEFELFPPQVIVYDEIPITDRYTKYHELLDWLVKKGF